MANGEQFMKTMIQGMSKAFDKPILEGNKPIGVVDALRQAIDSRMGITRNYKNQTFRDGENSLQKAVGITNLQNDFNKAAEKGGLSNREIKVSDWQRFKSLGYNLDGTMNYGRTAGMAVGFGGGAIAGLNLAADIVS